MKNEPITQYSGPGQSNFKLFCMDKWFEHKDEIFQWTGRNTPEYDSTYYFKKHRWLLKTLYKESGGTVSPKR